jgi:hypothetical protein
MDPSLSLVDSTTGHLIGQLRLDSDLHQLSIRHMVVDLHTRIWFGCQYRGEPGDSPQLIGYASLEGDIRLFELPPGELQGLRNYVGGLAVSDDGRTILASSPVGGSVLTIDAANSRAGRLLDFRRTCGAAPDPSGFVITNGFGEMTGIAGSDVAAQQFDFRFDEHLRRLSV